jgi:hypothetical protein
MTDLLETILYSVIALIAGLIVAQVIKEKFLK